MQSRSAAEPDRRQAVVAVQPAVAEPRTALRQAIALILLVAAVILIGYIDYITSPEYGFALFYLVPIVAAGWMYGHRSSLVVALIAAAAWFIADYLTRASLLPSLWNGLSRLVIFVSQGQLVASLHRDRRREALLARTDTITGLPNPRAFLERLENAVRGGGKLCVMYIDLDNFKRVNDLFGHAAGDAVLERSARALRDTIRGNDIAARIGRDEFAALLRDIDAPAAEGIAARVLLKLARIGEEYPGSGLGGSAGFALTQGGTRAEELIRAADDAMYEAKRKRKGSFAVRVLP